jgi:hypothetical protein
LASFLGSCRIQGSGRGLRGGRNRFAVKTETQGRFSPMPTGEPPPTPTHLSVERRVGRQTQLVFSQFYLSSPDACASEVENHRGAGSLGKRMIHGIASAEAECEENENRCARDHQESGEQIGREALPHKHECNAIKENAPLTSALAKTTRLFIAGGQRPPEPEPVSTTALASLNAVPADRY